MANAIVIVENPSWIQKETSILHDGYMVIYRFGFDANTKCSLTNNTRIQPNDALEGALNGWYECRLITMLPTSKERVIRYEKDNSTLETAIGLSAIIALGALYFSK